MDDLDPEKYSHSLDKKLASRVRAAVSEESKVSEKEWHTPEPWEWNPTSREDRGIALHAKGNCLIGILPGNSPLSAHDARRIVACVNACAGVETRTLELCSYQWQVDQKVDALDKLVDLPQQVSLMKAERDAMAKRLHDEQDKRNAEVIAIGEQRDALLAALKDCLLEHGGYTIRGECERKARAAIAAAT